MYSLNLPPWQKPLVETNEGKIFSRKDLVLIMANQDGGAYVDPEIDADYDELKVEHYGAQYAISNSPQATIQISHFTSYSRMTRQ